MPLPFWYHCVDVQLLCAMQMNPLYLLLWTGSRILRELLAGSKRGWRESAPWPSVFAATERPEWARRGSKPNPNPWVETFSDFGCRPGWCCSCAASPPKLSCQCWSGRQGLSEMKTFACSSSSSPADPSSRSTCHCGKRLCNCVMERKASNSPQSFTRTCFDGWHIVSLSLGLF